MIVSDFDDGEANEGSDPLAVAVVPHDGDR